jgi:hypothetical protein
MISTHPQHNKSEPGDQRPSRERPRFNSLVTADRLEEGSRFSGLPRTSKIRKGRRSVFREVGLEDEGKHIRTSDAAQSRQEERLSQASMKRSSSGSISPKYERKDSIGGTPTSEKPRWLSRLASVKRPKIKSAATTPPRAMSGIHRLTLIAVLIAVFLPAIRYNNGHQKVEVNGADAGVIKEPIVKSGLETRDNSPTDVCKRWAAQS